MDIEKTTQALLTEAKRAVEQSQSAKEIEQLKVHYLGKKGSVQALMHNLKDCTPEQRPAFGKAINELKEAVTEILGAALASLEAEELTSRLEEESLDITLPGRRPFSGKKHIITALLDEALETLIGMGFSVQYGPEVESEYYNFEALNFPPDHPARDMVDTFYIDPKTLLRTHTSNTQVRVMEGSKPPIRIAAPGKVYRNEDISVRSHVLFHQIEGLYIDRDVTFADLLSTMEEFYTKLMHREIQLRYRPSYFPFVEPGMEVDIACLACGGSGCGLCKQTGWLEVAGAGMVHPEVLKFGGIDPEEYSGYAWGMGIERLAMLRHGIPDIRLFLENRLSFLRQF